MNKAQNKDNFKDNEKEEDNNEENNAGNKDKEKVNKEQVEIKQEDEFAFNDMSFIQVKVPIKD